MNYAGDAIFLIDEEGNLVGTNKKAETLLGYTKQELLGMNISQIHPKEEFEKKYLPAFKGAIKHERVGEWIERIGWEEFFKQTGIDFTFQHIDDFTFMRDTLRTSAAFKY